MPSRCERRRWHGTRSGSSVGRHSVSAIHRLGVVREDLGTPRPPKRAQRHPTSNGAPCSKRPSGYSTDPARRLGPGTCRSARSHTMQAGSPLLEEDRQPLTCERRLSSRHDLIQGKHRWYDVRLSAWRARWQLHAVGFLLPARLPAWHSVSVDRQLQRRTMARAVDLLSGRMPRGLFSLNRCWPPSPTAQVPRNIHYCRRSCEFHDVAGDYRSPTRSGSPCSDVGRA